MRQVSWTEIPIVSPLFRVEGTAKRISQRGSPVSGPCPWCGTRANCDDRMLRRRRPPYETRIAPYRSSNFVPTPNAVREKKNIITSYPSLRIYMCYALLFFEKRRKLEKKVEKNQNRYASSRQISRQGFVPRYYTARSHVVPTHIAEGVKLCV